MTINHINIVVSDIEASVAFYTRLLGMQVTFRCHLEGEWIETITGLENISASCAFLQPASGGCRIELLQYISPDGQKIEANSKANTIGLRHFALEVDSLNELIPRLRKENIPIFSDPLAVPFRIVNNIQKQLCYTLDPDGVIIEFSQHTVG